MIFSDNVFDPRCVAVFVEHIYIVLHTNYESGLLFCGVIGNWYLSYNNINQRSMEQQERSSDSPETLVFVVYLIDLFIEPLRYVFHYVFLNMDVLIG